MLHTVNWLARSLGFAWAGLLTFALIPPHGPLAVSLQAGGYGLLGLSFLAWALLDLHPAGARYPWGLPLVLGVMAVAAGLGCAAGYGGSVMVVFGFIAALIAGGDVALPAALAVTGAGILAIEIGGLAYGASIGVLLGFPTIVLAGLIIGRNRGAYRIQAEQSAALLAQRERLQAEQRRADLLDERARIAREIHDVLAHSLGALGIQIQAARAVLSDYGDIDRAGQLLATAQQMAGEGLTETRRAVHALRADTGPLAGELARISDIHAQRYHVAASFGTGGVPAPLPPEATVALLRVAQEALVNAAKHATGQDIEVRLDYEEADVRLTVRNELGLDSAAGPPGAGTVNGGYGLTGMRERLRLLDGTLRVGRDGRQWIVAAQVPRPRAGTAAL